MTRFLKLVYNMRKYGTNLASIMTDTDLVYRCMDEQMDGWTNADRRTKLNQYTLINFVVSGYNNVPRYDAFCKWVT